MTLLGLLRNPSKGGRTYVPFVENAYYIGMATGIFRRRVQVAA